MQEFIPNTTQKEKFLTLFRKKYPTKTRIAILNSGMVVNRRPNSGSDMLGQIIKLDGLFTVYSLCVGQHSMLALEKIKEPESELELLKERVARLEEKYGE